MSQKNSGETKGTVNILSITIDSQITPSLNENPIQLPNWPAGADRDGWEGSERPGVFQLAGEDKKNQSTLLVELEVNAPGAFDKATLTGKLGLAAFKGTVNGNINGKQTVTVTIDVEPTQFHWLWGGMEWTLSSGENPVPVSLDPSSTWLEMFWIYGYPGKMFTRGVWIEALRLLAGQLNFDIQTKDQVTQRVVNFVHSCTLLKYDIFDAVPSFEDIFISEVFNLSAYIDRRFPSCNCYDQAGAVEILLGALGIEAKYRYMEPYGYLNPTLLVGRGRTNNPFFMGKGASAELLPQNDKRRTNFGNHAFCLMETQVESQSGQSGQVILDATVGPHLGGQTPEEYLKSSIDYATTLANDENTGTLKDIDPVPGILDLHSLTTYKRGLKNSRGISPRLERFSADIGLDKLEPPLTGDTGAVCPWPSPMECPVIEEAKWQIHSKRVWGGLETASNEWKLVRGNNEELKIQLYVINEGIKDKKAVLLKVAEAISKQDIHLEKKELSQGESGEVTYYVGYRILVWNPLNVFLWIQAYDTAFDLAPICEWFAKVIFSHVKKISPNLPVIGHVEVNPPSGKIKVNQEITFRFDASNLTDPYSMIMDFFMANQTLKLVRQKNPSHHQDRKIFEFTFKAREPGTNKVQLVLVDTQTLLCSKPWEIDVEIQ
jgi:hypothetical protein